jgi:hypothetical protein
MKNKYEWESLNYKHKYIKDLSLQGQCWKKENQITKKSTPKNQLSQT